MADFFSVSEVLQFAVRIEENGERFYRLAAQNMGEKKTKELFLFLADEEVTHRKTFQGMIEKVETYEPAESYPGEYFAFLKAYADEHIFTPEKKAEVAAKKVQGPKEALQFAIGLEVDSILYYLEAKNLVPKNHRDAMDRIIDEERHHYLKLSEIRKGL
ncbi:MAG: ferritin family protein [Candidatus Omnitrophota bacterium]